MASRVLLHVGTPKTGTSAFQHALFVERESLRERGVLYHAERFDEHFIAALDLMELPWGGLEREAIGAWDRLAAAIRAWPGTAIVSHEILGRANRLQVGRAMASLGDAEVHVVLTARDLVRQLPAEWQENIKHRRTLRYEQFLDAVRDPARTKEIAQWFWGVQEVPDILGRWGEGLPAAHVHVVTLPPAGSAPGLLTDRLSDAFGLDATTMTATTDRANASLGVAESALVRQLNKRLGGGVLPNHYYRELVRELLVHQNLGVRRESPRLTVPPDVHAWARDLSLQWTGEIAERGYDVIGDLGDLVAPERPEPFANPDLPDPDQLAEAGLRALTASVLENARLREVEAGLQADVADLCRQIDELHATPIYKAKERLVGLADHNPVARGALGTYRRLRGKSSRST